jgi:enoyl-[acyl-carrier protein] reductase I
MLSVVYDASVSDLLKGRLAVILGVANKWSIAYAIANAFSREGAELALTYLSDREKKQVESFAADWNVAATFQCDVSRDEDLVALHDNIKALNRPVHTVMHSLAFAKHEELGNPFVQTSRDGFLLAQNVSSYSLVAVARSLVPLMAQGGSIITLTYIGSTRVVPNYNVMGVAKASLEATASDLGPQGIRVNAISAGPIKTVSARGVKDFSTILEVMQQRAPLRRNTDPNEVADAAVFLASDLARGVTGNLLFVDCGMSVMG